MDVIILVDDELIKKIAHTKKSVANLTTFSIPRYKYYLTLGLVSPPEVS